jgi:glycyl-tRNA synthetase beta chain
MTGKAEAQNAETLLVELLTEELPPGALLPLAESFARALAGDLRRGDFLEPDSEVRSYATPRRLGARITRVRARAPDKSVEFSGPSVKAGLDADGRPTPALLGFAGKHGVEVSELVRRRTPRGEFFFRVGIARGGELAAGLGSRVSAALEALPVPKTMRWGAGEAAFARPVHGLVMMHGPHVIAGEALGVASSNRTRGHRFLCAGAIELKHADGYEDALREQGKVLAGFAARRAAIEQALMAAAADARPVVNDALLDEITAIVEYPAVYAGEFDPTYLVVPEECLILSMQQHQKYVPLRDGRSGKLLPRFLFVSNIAVEDPREIVRGNERVLRARLADARFFFEQDRRTRLEARVPRLAHVVYHSRLGSQLERVERIQLLAGKIAREIGADPLLAERAAWLSKADLLTEMVGEFPELQGVMGRYYGVHDGERDVVTDAIEQHYRPRFAGDALPQGPVACAVALGDKLDALAGLFSIGQHPSGDKDPYGLRRAALGIVRILVEKRLPLSLMDLANAAFEPFRDRFPLELVSFINDRFSGYLRDLGFTTLQIDAVLSRDAFLPHLVPARLEAVKAFQAMPEAESLAAANKRVANILRQAEARGESFADARPEQLKEPAERALHEALRSASDAANVLFDRGDYAGYLSTFAVLKAPVDAFFDSVMVMADDPRLRRSRLALLRELREAMNRVADLSKLAA